MKTSRGVWGCWKGCRTKGAGFWCSASDSLSSPGVQDCCGVSRTWRMSLGSEVHNQVQTLTSRGIVGEYARDVVGEMKTSKAVEGNFDENDGEREEVVICGYVQFLLQIQHHPQRPLHPIPYTVRVRDLSLPAQSNLLRTHSPVRRHSEPPDVQESTNTRGMSFCREKMSREAVEDEKRRWRFTPARPPNFESPDAQESANTRGMSL